MRRPAIRSSVHDPIGAMGLINGGVRHWLERGNGIDLWGRVMGVRDWIREMGLICGGTPWGLLHWLDVGFGGVPWERATGWGWWNWFVGESHGGARHWLDPGDGIDLIGCAMGARDTGWIGAMGLIHGDVPNEKVIWVLNLNDTMCPHVWRWAKCAECVWLRGW